MKLSITIEIFHTLIAKRTLFPIWLPKNEYFPEDLPKEYRANAGASILMANDTAFHYVIKKFNSFKEVTNYFFMSKSTLRNKIIDIKLSPFNNFSTYSH